VSLSDLQRQIEAERFEKWKKGIESGHAGGHFLPNEALYFTPLARPLAQSTVALITSLGVHLKSDRPFDILNPHGDPTIREIPGDVDSAELMATHGHLDTGPANQDINVALPIDRLRELAASGRIGRVAQTHYGLMGFCPEIERMRDEVGPELARRLHDQRVDAVVLTAG
jgi:D-proline reductase (dithiol) PrdB